MKNRRKITVVYKIKSVVQKEDKNWKIYQK